MDYEIDNSEKEEESLDLELKKEMFVCDCTNDFIDLFGSIKEVLPYFSKISTAKIVCNILEIVQGKNLKKNFEIKSTSKEYNEFLTFIQENVNTIINNNKRYYNIKNNCKLSFNDVINCIYNQ
jgi:transcription-repair coupling factor (superfamily II helicase)